MATAGRVEEILSEFAQGKITIDSPDLIVSAGEMLAHFDMSNGKWWLVERSDGLGVIAFLARLRDLGLDEAAALVAGRLGVPWREQ
jgi:hypothetical protein